MMRSRLWSVFGLIAPGYLAQQAPRRVRNLSLKAMPLTRSSTGGDRFRTHYFDKDHMLHVRFTRLTVPFRLCASLVLLGAGLAGLPSLASAADTYRFELPAQSLRASLDAYTRITGIEVRVSDPALVQRQARPLRGDLSPAAALTELLSASGLAYTFTGDKLVTVAAVAASTEPGSRLLAPVRVQGSDGAPATAGVNGSSDPTATEGTHSLTSNLLTIGTKAPLAIKDTPQTVSVITRQRIEDQHLDTLADVLTQTPGVTVSQAGSGGDNVNPTFYSRGFAVRDFQIDGGSPLTSAANSNYTSSFVPVFDTSIYDHVEILRGAAGLFNGVGDPGGIISLERKRPLDHRQLMVDAQVGSFQMHRISIDGSTPLLDDGRLAIRGVITRDTHDFFYHTANKKSTIGYVNAEAKLLADTTVNLGATYTETDTLPWFAGLPRAAGGGDLGLPRDTCLCTPGSSYKVHGTEWFAELRQKLGADWSLQANFSNDRQTQTSDYTGFQAPYSGIDPATGAGLFTYGFRGHTQSNQQVLDLVANGEVELFGRRHQLTVGADSQRVMGGAPGNSAGDGNVSFSPPLDSVPSIYTLNPALYSPNASATADPLDARPTYDQTQWGLYVNSRWQLADPLHLALGWRLGSYRTKQTSIASFDGTVTHLDFAEHTHLPPTVGLSYDLSPEMTAYASYAGIFQSQASLLTAVGGRPLKPVTGTNIELGLKRSDFDKTLNSSISIYRIVQKNSGQPYGDNVPDDPTTGVHCCYVDSGNKEKSKGFDAEISGALTPRWQVAASYTFNLKSYKPGVTDEFNFANYNLQSVPKNLFKLWTTYALAGNEVLARTQLGFGLRAQNSTQVNGRVYPTTGPSTPFSFVQGGYAIADMMARYRIAKGTDVQLNVNNLFDRTYYSTVGGLQSGNWYGAPRNFLLSLHWAI